MDYGLNSKYKNTEEIPPAPVPEDERQSLRSRYKQRKMPGVIEIKPLMVKY